MNASEPAERRQEEVGEVPLLHAELLRRAGHHPPERAEQREREHAPRPPRPGATTTRGWTPEMRSATSSRSDTIRP